MNDLLKVAAAQIAPVWLDRDQTIEKIVQVIGQAGEQGCQLVAFGETLLPGYPFWIEWTDGARFNDAFQKEMHAHYLDQAVNIEAGHLDAIGAAARDAGITVVLGIAERPSDRGGHSIYATLVTINAQGVILATHRKLMPTYEERLTWSPGDGHGLQVHRLGAFTVGGLNCWENWMPLPRTALYGLGEDLHIALWPGAVRNTQDITRFLALEGRSYVLSASSLMRKNDIPAHIPHAEAIRARVPDVLADGGSCLAAPNGDWVIAPCADEERLLVATIDHQRVREERQNFDPAGHYSRPDVTRLIVNRTRQHSVIFE